MNLKSNFYGGWAKVNPHLNVSRSTIIIAYICAVICLASATAQAGYIELGLSGNYRKSFINSDNYSTTEAYTNSLAYYFWEFSAIETSYTKGISTSASPNFTAVAEFQLTGLDFILTFAGRESAVRPYVKLGGAYQKKSITYKYLNLPPDTQYSEGPSPSVGLGVQIRFSDAFAIKAGAEAWSSPLTNDASKQTTYDVAGRVGISWLF